MMADWLSSLADSGIWGRIAEEGSDIARFYQEFFHNNYE